MKISEIDKNLLVPETLSLPDVKWYGAGNANFKLYGACGECGDGPFRRLPQDVADAANPGVVMLATNTAGIRLRLRTDSPYVAIHAEWDVMCAFSHMPFSGTSGFDLYRVKDGRQEFAGSFIPPLGSEHGYESALPAPGGMQDLVIYFPLYNNVTKLFIGVREGSVFEVPGQYSVPLPVVFYGSSITQGGCASRPGNAYQNMLSRGLDIDIVNLGFSGSARGEEPVAEYIAGLPMSAFVLDYDHNAPDIDHLRLTHYPFYKIIRDKNPELPIIMLSKPDGRNVNSDVYEHNLKRAEVVRTTYERAVSEGDNKVWFIDGFSLFEDDELWSSTVDTCHPNDLGFYQFYRALKPVLADCLK